MQGRGHKCSVCNCNHIPFSLALWLCSVIAEGRRETLWWSNKSIQYSLKSQMDTLFIASLRDVGLLWVCMNLMTSCYKLFTLKLFWKPEQKNLLKLSKSVFGKASSQCFTRSLHLFVLPFGGQRCLFIQFCHWRGDIIIIDCLMCTVSHRPLLCFENI